MRYADLDHARAGTRELHHQLRVDHRSDALEIDAIEHRSAEELEGAVDVADRHVEHDPNEDVPTFREEATGRRILSIDPITGDDVHVVDQCDEALELVEVELVVRVGEEDEVELRGFESGPQRLAVAQVPLVTQQADARVGGGVLENDLRGSVPRPVVDDDDLESVT